MAKDAFTIMALHQELFHHEDEQQDVTTMKRSRITIDISPELRRRIKVAASQRDVSSLLTYEVTNILYREVRAGKITPEIAEDGINLIFRTVSPVFSHYSALNLRALALANQFGLSAAYDTHYLALAERKECSLWTADTRMWRAVKNQFDWVYWIGDYPIL